MINLPTFLAALPFLVFIVLLLWERTSLLQSSIFTLALFTVLAIFYWNIFPASILFSYGKGFFIAFDIFIIIFGAIFFLKMLEGLQVIENISYYLEHFSGDYRLQIILLAWLFEAFLEGTAGFGTPVAIVAPLLVGLGLTPIKALVVALMGNSAAGVFGAVGTPIRVGFAGLNVASVPLLASLINCVGFIIPIFILWTITAGRVNRKKEFLDALPFAIWAGLAFVLPSVLIVSWGQEFPTLVGSVIGTVLILLTTRLGLFVPKNKVSLRQVGEKLFSSMSAVRAFLPYGLLILLLVLGKMFIGDAGIKISLGFSHIFGLFNPGFAFILAGLLVAVIWRIKKGAVASLVSKSFVGALNPFLVILSMSVLAQMMINSGQNYSGLPSAITLVAKVFETPLLPFFAPFVGAFGSFITGSVTISNIMFGNFFNTAAIALGNNVAVILSLAVVGAAAGNMIALSDMLAAEAVLGVKNQELKILKGIFIPCLLFLVIVGSIGLLL